MTCVLSSPWQAFSSSYGWSSMNPAEGSSTPSGLDRSQHGYISSESESRQPSSSSGKKRASRAGTRSVTTLSAAQLERKRANDREAQRAIRQRTKDHIEQLERNVNDLRIANEATEKLAAVTSQRNHELAEENNYLRTKLGEAGYHINIPQSESARPPDQGLLGVHSTSPAAQTAGPNIPRQESAGTPRSLSSITASQSSSSRHGSWQGNFPAPAPSATPSLTSGTPMQMGSTLTTWRSHDGTQNVHPSTGQLQDPSHNPTQPGFASGHPNDRPSWAAATPPHYPYQEQQRQQHFEPSPQPQQAFAQASVQSFAPAPTPPQTAYHAPPPPAAPQSEFQSLAVSSPGTYQVPAQPSFTQAPQYQMTPMQVAATSGNPDYAPAQGQMQPPPIPASPYHATQADQQYGQQIHPPMQYRDDSGARSYSMTHYPSG